MGGEVLLEGAAGSELIAGSDQPESHRRIAADPTVHLAVLVVT